MHFLSFCCPIHFSTTILWRMICLLIYYFLHLALSEKKNMLRTGIFFLSFSLSTLSKRIRRSSGQSIASIVVILNCKFDVIQNPFMTWRHKRCYPSPSDFSVHIGTNHWALAQTIGYWRDHRTLGCFMQVLVQQHTLSIVYLPLFNHNIISCCPCF